MKQLTRDDIINGQPLQVELVQVPQLEGEVYVREMTAGERDGFEIDASKDNIVRARLAGICACDAGGVRLFTDADLPILSALPAVIIDAIFTAAQRLNRLTEDDKETEKN